MTPNPRTEPLAPSKENPLMTDEVRCRVCSRPAQMRLDDTVKTHQVGGARCDGSLQPPAGDPPCTLSCGRDVGRVSWPVALDPSRRGPMAATFVCERPSHQREAAEWVRSLTGHEGVFVASKAAEDV
jgi:hypothetical protein